MNYLALLELILREVRDSGGEITHDLERLAARLGLSEDQIEDALMSDRMLVIYEP